MAESAPRAAARWVSARWKGGVEALAAAALHCNGLGSPSLEIAIWLQICACQPAPVGSGPFRGRTTAAAPKLSSCPSFASSAVQFRAPRQTPRTASSTPLPPRFLSRDWDGNAFRHTHLTSFAVYGPSQRHRQSLFPVAEATGSVSVTPVRIKPPPPRLDPSQPLSPSSSPLAPHPPRCLALESHLAPLHRHPPPGFSPLDALLPSLSG